MGMAKVDMLGRGELLLFWALASTETTFPRDRQKEEGSKNLFLGRSYHPEKN